MMIELNIEEAKILKEALTSQVSELGMEIADTDRKDFRDHLKRRKMILMGLVDKIKDLAA
jgi:hypothetical protein